MGGRDARRPSPSDEPRWTRVYSPTEDGPPRPHVVQPAGAEAAAKRAGIQPLPSAHDLRHTAGAVASRAGMHPMAVKEMMGHSRIRVTYDIYGHLHPTMHAAGIQPSRPSSARLVPPKRRSRASIRTGSIRVRPDPDDAPPRRAVSAHHRGWPPGPTNKVSSRFPPDDRTIRAPTSKLPKGHSGPSTNTMS